MWKDWIKDNKGLLVLCCALTLLIAVAVVALTSPGGLKQLPQASKIRQDMPRFETVHGKGGTVLTLEAVPFSSSQPFINPEYSNFGLLDRNHLYIYDDVDLSVFKRKLSEKNEVWALDKSYLSEGKWQSSSTITDISGKSPFLLIETFDEADAAFFIDKNVSQVPWASGRLLEKAVLMSHTRKGLSFADNTAVQRFELDDAGLIVSQEPLSLQGLQTDKTKGHVQVRDVVTAYYDDQKGIHLVAEADDKIWVLSYKPNGDLVQQTSMPAKKFGAPKSITPVKGGVVLAASSGLTVIRNDGAVDVFDARSLIERDSARMPAYVIGFDVDKDSPYLCVAAKISDRSPTQFYIAKAQVKIGK